MDPLFLLFRFSLLSCIPYAIPFPSQEGVNEKGDWKHFLTERQAKLAKYGQFTYIMRIVYPESDYILCLGNLITKSSVLSAASCVTDIYGVVQPTEDREGVFGSVQIGVNETRVKFREFRVHKAFDQMISSDDISILILQEEIELGHLINIVALPKKGVSFDGQKVASVGWRHGIFDDSINRLLTYYEAEVQNSTECSQYAEDYKHVCIPNQGINFVVEDYNGGPLVSNKSSIDTCIGINPIYYYPHYEDAADKRTGPPSVLYLSTSAYHDWIKENAVGEIVYA